MRNPVVIMAMLGRREFVKVNLQHIEASVVVAASLQEDFDFLRALRAPHLQIVPVSNNPLGAKWQAAVNAARILGADPLITLGSDDFLSAGFIKKAVELSQYNDFIFFDKWHIFDCEGRKYYSLDYQMDKFSKPPLGSGRVFSSRFLESHSWQLFDPSMSKRLDDFAWNNHRDGDRLLKNPEGMSILAIKGRHETMNPLNTILSSESIRWQAAKEIPNFGFNPKETF